MGLWLPTELEGKGKDSWRLLCPPCVCWELPRTGVAHPAAVTALWCKWGCLFTSGCSLYPSPGSAPALTSYRKGRLHPEVRAAVSQTFPWISSSPAFCSPKEGDKRLAPGPLSPWWSQRAIKPSPEGPLATKSQESSKEDYFSCLSLNKPYLLWFETADVHSFKSSKPCLVTG